MDSDNDSFHFPKCQTHAYTRFENGCSGNSTQKLLTKYSTEENNKHTLFAGLGRSVLGKTAPSVLGTQDLWRSFSQYGPPGRQITYIYYMEESVLLGTKPLVDSIRHFIRDPSGVFSVCLLCECRIVQ